MRKFPTALLPDERLVWAPIDDFHAMATLTDGPNVVSLQFEFASNGDIVGAFSPDRFRESSGQYIKSPWGVTCRRYEKRGGKRIPVDCEVYWKDADRIVPYWRGEVVDASYDFE